MSRLLIARSADLQRLQNEGFDLEVRAGYLLIKDVPYATANREIKYGTLISSLKVTGDVTDCPDTHVAYWTGEHPCHNNGLIINAIANSSPAQSLGNGIQADFTFSAKAAYRDYHHKMTTYIGRITGEAQAINPAVSAQTFPVIATEEEESVFKYLDTATTRVGIGAFNERFANQRVGIVGLGGTGSYLFDLVAKTCVREIHLFDGDVFSQHNAFRTPGAPSIDELRAKPKKVAYLAANYGKMRRGIHVHDNFLDASTVEALRGLDFVFLCLDSGAAKKAIVMALMAGGIPFIEVGMGIVRGEDSLAGLMRVTACTNEVQEQVVKKMNFSDGNRAEDDYSTNIQIAELNAMNAALAVIRWKKLYGFYRDSSRAYSYGYSIAANEMVNEDEA
ncbi:MAG TPA: ThiF family adenylyltransferase [Gallionella sp.]|nr:ThiF family adenylyltransferase [Gallionella sp.]